MKDEHESSRNDDPFGADELMSDELQDPMATYAENGQKRAHSEARRTWKYACDFEGCEQRFNRPCRLEAHKRSHTNERPFACPYEDCDKTFPRKDHLNRHLQNAHSDVKPERPFGCDWEDCGKRFVSNSQLKRHREVHETKFYCTGYAPCKEVFRKQKTLDAHIKSKHLASDAYPCTYVDDETGEHCTKGYQTESALRRHMRTSHGSGEQEQEHAFFCVLCPAPGTEFEAVETETGIVVRVAKEPLEFATYQELATHSHACHPPVCTECNITFATQGGLKDHINAAHVKPESCPQFACPHPECGRIFNRQHNLDVHISSVHRKQKRFICEASAFTDSNKVDLKAWDGQNACGAAMGAKASLEQHVRTQHLKMKNRKELRKERKSKRMPEPSMLRSLTGVGFDGGRNVICEVEGCDYRFFQPRDLKRHLRAVHKLEDVDIEAIFLERNARDQTGPFWCGGVDDPMFESTESSVLQTPDPYQDPEPYYQGPIIPEYEDYKPIDPRLTDLQNPFDQLRLLTEAEDEAAEEADMDAKMGLSEVQMWNTQHGLDLS